MSKYKFSYLILLLFTIMTPIVFFPIPGWSLETDLFYDQKENFENKFLFKIDTLRGDDLIDSTEILADSINTTTNRIEIGLGINTLTQHPHTSLPGYGINLGYTTGGKKHYFGISFKYQQLNYRFDYNASFSENSFGIIDIAIDTLNNEQITTYSTYTERYKTSIRHHNRYKIFSIPVFYGHTLSDGKVGVGIESGFQVLIIKFAEGRINSFSNSNSIIRIEDSNVFNKNFSLSFLAQLRVNYSITDQWSIYTRLGWTQALNSWYKDKNNVIKPKIISAEIGLRKSF